MELLSVPQHVVSKVQPVRKRQGEQTHVDAFLQNLLVEHRHVDDVGRPANQKQDGQKHHVFQSTDEVFHFETDDVVGVVPGDKVLELEDEASSRC